MSNFTDVDALAAEPGVAGALRRPRRRSWPTPTSWCCPAPGHGRGPGLAARAGAGRRGAARGPPRGGRCSASAAATRCSAETIEDDVESGAARSTGSGCCRCGSAFAREDPGPARRARRCGEPVDGLRDPPRRRAAGAGGGRAASWTAAGSARSGARTGTARWRTTASAGPSCAEVAPAAGRRASCRRPDTAFAALREEQLDRLGDLVAEHADTGALLPADRAGPPCGAAVRTARGPP